MPSTVLLFGKLSSGGDVNSLPAGSPTSNLLFLRNLLSSRCFLVDTGASVSVFPHRPRSPSAPPTGLQLRTADGSPLDTYGTRILPLKFGTRSFEWEFLLADVSTPIIGSDFLRHHHLLVDVAGSRLLDASTLEPIPAASRNNLSTTSQLYTALLSTPSDFRDLLAEYPDVVSARFSSSPPKHAVRHSVPTVPGPPVFAKARRLDAEKLESARKEFAAMEAAGIIRRSSSPWSSPLHMVRKPDGSWRPCGDYRRLNTQTVPDRYPLPNTADFSTRLQGCKYFTKLDLTKGYYQVPMLPEDVPKTAVVTPFGMFEWLRMPFGLRNAGCTFQRMMDQIFGDLPYCFVYLDDILIASTTREAHLEHVRSVLDLLRLHGLSINPEKCVFAAAELDFLGMHVSAAGCLPVQKHTDVIASFPRPADRKGLQRFLGIINYYRRFIKNAAQTLLPLTDALKGGKRTLNWSPDMLSAFSAAKNLLCTVPTLVHPDPSAAISVSVDASGSSIGAVLQQDVAGVWAPLSFYSRKLSPSETRYSAFDRELLAAWSALRHFRFLLEGNEFVLYTDHKPLTQALFRTSPPWSAMQQRRLSYISEFNCHIKHLPGSENVVADALSRPVLALQPSPQEDDPSVTSALTPPPPALPPPSVGISFSAMAELQKSCQETLQLRQSSTLQIVSVPVSGGSLLCDQSTGSLRPLVPLTLRRRVFDALHAVTHPGVRASRRLLSSRFVWQFMAKDITSWSRSCLDCQRNKIQTHVHVPVQPIPVPSRRFSHLHVDLVGPLPTSQGFSHIFTIIDRTTRWPEAVPLKSTTAEECARAILRHWIPIFGVPSLITSDRGAQFTSSVWSSLCSALGIARSSTTSFHPESNGIVERFHRQLKTSLRARLAGSDWYEHLPLVMLGLRTVPKDDSAFSAAEAVFGSPLSLPGEFLDTPDFPPDSFLRRIQGVLKRTLPVPLHHSTKPQVLEPTVLPPSLAAATHVFVREDSSKPPLSPLYRGPYLVVSKFPKYFRLKIGSRVDSISVDRLKPVVSDFLVRVQDPPRRGRPPASVPPPSFSPALFPVPPAPVPTGSTQAPVPTPSRRRNPWRATRGYHRLLQLVRDDAGGTPVEDDL